MVLSFLLLGSLLLGFSSKQITISQFTGKRSFTDDKETLNHLPVCMFKKMIRVFREFIACFKSRHVLLDLEYRPPVHCPIDLILR